MPLLGALYPMAIVLVLMGMLHRACDRVPLTWPATIGLVGASSVVTSLRDAFAPDAWLPLDALPLADLGLGWIVLAAAGLVIGAALSHATALALPSAE